MTTDRIDELFSELDEAIADLDTSIGTFERALSVIRPPWYRRAWRWLKGGA